MSDTQLQESLPDDIDKLKSMIEEKDRRISQLEHDIEIFRKMLIGPKSEKRKPEPNQGRQLNLFLDELRERAEDLAERNKARATTTLESEGKPKRKPARRKKFPPHLPVARSLFELDEKERQCCGQTMSPMGEVVTRQLERIEVCLVHEIVRKKYACRVCESHIRTAPGPDRVIDKGMLGPGMLAHIITEKYGNHMPYNRQEKKYGEEGLDLSRVVMIQSAGRVAELLEPIWLEMKKRVLASEVIHTDDTGVIELSSTRDGERRKARFWIYADKEDRLFYDFTESRERDGPMALLGEFQGYLQADAYAGYDVLYHPEGAKEVACWAHARRKFDEAESTDPELANEALDRIGKLYDIERVAKERGLDAAATVVLRQEYAVPLLEEFEAWLELARTEVLDKSPMARAINYCLNQWKALSRYPENGLIEIDNNRAERGLRAIAVGRKNWMFVGNEGGGKTAAIFFTLVQTCRALGIDPREYLRDVLYRISTCSDITKLTPHGWKEHFADATASHRQEIAVQAVAIP